MKGKYVLVTTKFRGVFMGKLKSENGDTAVLDECQNCIYWSKDVGGFLGLSTKGPSRSCRIGPPAKNVKLFGITSMNEVSDAAKKSWKGEPWG